MKAAFLDRDGIINKERGDYTWRKEDFVFTENLFPFLRDLQSRGYALIIITNQGGINKGKYTNDDVKELHDWMQFELKKEGINLLDVYYCPHHDSLQKCICRKPDSGLLEKAVQVHSIDKSQSFMIGDRTRDTDAGEKIGIRGILVDANPDWDNISIDWNE